MSCSLLLVFEFEFLRLNLCHFVKSFVEIDSSLPVLIFLNQYRDDINVYVEVLLVWTTHRLSLCCFVCISCFYVPL